MKSKNFLWLIALLFILAFGYQAFGQTRRNLSGWCEDGGQVVVTDGRSSTTKVQRSYPLCTVTVFDAGTSNLSTIASDSGGTPKSNPFVASGAGRWDFWALQGQYDIQFSGSGLTTFTRPALWITTPATGGTGDVVGPSSATDNAIARFDLTTGKLIQNSVVLVGDTGNVTGLGTLNTHTIPAGTDTFTLNNLAQTLQNKTLGVGTLITLGSDVLGDMYYRGAGPLLTRLGIGLNGQCLTVVAGLPTWGSCIQSSGGGTTLAAGADTQVQFNDGGTFLGADSGFTFAKASDTLGLGTASTTTGVIRLFNNSNTNFTALIGGAPSSSINLTLPALQTDTLVGAASAQVLTGKTLTASSNILGGVTTQLGGDATGDTYYRNSGGQLAKLAIGSGSQVLGVSAGLPAWVAGPTTINPTDTRIPYRSSSTAFADSSLTVGTNLALSSAITARTSGSPTHFFRLVTPADTNLTLSVESVGAQIGGDTSAATVTRNWATGALGTQREHLFVHPTYSFAGASTITNAATVAITDCPTAGSNATITNCYSLWTQKGTVRADSAANSGVDLIQWSKSSSATNTVANLATVAQNSNGTAAAGFGQSTTYQLESSTTDNREAAKANVYWHTATDASRGSVVSFSNVSNALTVESELIAPRKNLTDATATDLVEITLPTLKGAGGVISYSAFATNGTDVHDLTGIVRFAAVNKAGTYTTNATIVSEGSVVSDAGTFTCTWSFNNGTDKTTLRVSCDTTLTPTTLYIKYHLTNASEQAMILK